MFDSCGLVPWLVRHFKSNNDPTVSVFDKVRCVYSCDRAPGCLRVFPTRISDTMGMAPVTIESWLVQGIAGVTTRGYNRELAATLENWLLINRDSCTDCGEVAGRTWLSQRASPRINPCAYDSVIVSRAGWHDLCL